MADELRIRCSSLSNFVDCERRSAARMFTVEIEAAGHRLHSLPRGIGASIGTSVHAGVAYTLTEKATDGHLSPDSAMTDAAVHEFREIARQGIDYDKETSTANMAERQVTRMALAYQTTIAPTVEPILVEQRFEVDTGIGFILSGQSDLIAREPKTLRDLKSGKRRGHHKAQIGAYSLISRAHGHEIEHAKEDFVARTPLTKPQATPLTFTYDLAVSENAAWSILKRIKVALEGFRNGSEDGHLLAGDPWHFTANPASMLCSRRFCSAYGTSWCHEWRSNESDT